MAEAAAEQLATELGKGTESMLVWQLLERHELISAPGWSPSTRASHRHHIAPLIAEPDYDAAPMKVPAGATMSAREQADIALVGQVRGET